MGELIFYSKIKCPQCFQCLAAVLSHVESLGNFKNKYKIKKEKVRNQTIHNKVQQKKKKNTRRRRTDPTEKKKKKKKGRGRQTDQQRRRRKKGKKKKKQLLHDATPASSSSSFFSPSSLFSFLTNDVLAWYPFTGQNSRISPTQPVRDQYGWYFFQYEIRGYLYRCTDRNGIYRLY